MDKPYQEVLSGATAEQQAKQQSPLTIIVACVVGGSVALAIVLFTVRLARLDGNWREATQYGIGGFLVPWVILGVGALVLLLRELVYLFEVTTKRDITGDGALGKPQIIAMNPYQGRNARAADRRADEQSLFGTFVRGCGTKTAWRDWDGTISRKTWSKWRKLLIDSGFAEAMNPEFENSAWYLTTAPDEIIAKLTPQQINA